LTEADRNSSEFEIYPNGDVAPKIHNPPTLW